MNKLTIEKTKDLAVAYAELKQELAETKKELDDFSYIISHDLKAPLRAILTLSTWISEDYKDSFDEEGQEQLTLLNSRVQRLHDLIDGVLQYSRIGRLMNAPNHIDLNWLVKKVINDELDVPETTTIYVTNNLPAIFADQLRIYQLFIYLLQNAITFSKGQERSSNIKVYHITTNEGDTVFVITDNGRGIRERDQERVFKIFRTVAGGGLGLGLTLSKKIISCYKGKIWLESAYGKGTSVYFTLPAAFNNL